MKFVRGLLGFNLCVDPSSVPGLCTVKDHGFSRTEIWDYLALH